MPFSELDRAVPIVLIGCGAVARLFYAPTLRELARRGEVTTVAVCDPNETARLALAAELPGALACASLEEALTGARLAIIASPPRWHRQQAEAAFAAGLEVLCEKPLAGTEAEAEAMCQAARAAGRLLAAGHYKRYFPTHQWIKTACTGHTPFGSLRRAEIAEGGKFAWPAASASFFQRSETPGGVLLDLGVHVLDLLRWWLGEPQGFTYEDDALGGLEANCRLRATWAGPAEATVRLSRDWPTANTYDFTFENGSVRLRVNQANRWECSLRGLPGSVAGEIFQEGCLTPADTNPQAFIAQLRDVVDAVRTRRPPAVPGEEGAAVLRWIESCYARRTRMQMPWMPELATIRG